MFLVPIDKLHVPQIGRIFLTVIVPPSCSLITCPHMKFNCVISVFLQHKHLLFPISSPIYVFHTNFLIMAGIFCFFCFSSCFSVLVSNKYKSCNDCNNNNRFYISEINNFSLFIYNKLVSISSISV